MPKVSIVTVTYNAEKTLGATIQSVIRQHYKDLEYIIIDGKSTDKTREIIQKYASIGVITKWVSEKDRGIYDAMNKGIALASGRYLYFLQAGDCMRDGVLEKIDKYFEEERSWFIYGDVWWSGKRYAGPFSKWKLSVKNICQQAIFYHQNVFEKFGLHDIRYIVEADHLVNFKVFSSPETHPIYVDEVIADFEDGGFSGLHRDLLYKRTRFLVIYRTLGLFVCLYAIAYSFLLKFCCIGKRIIGFVDVRENK